MIDIFLRASDLAKLTGHNKYNDIQETIDQILKSNKICDRYVPKSNTEGCLAKLSTADFKKIAVALQLPDTSSLQEVEKKVKQTILKDSYSSVISEEVSKTKVEENLKDNQCLKVLESSLKQDLQMRRGNIKEAKNLNQIQTKQNIRIRSRNSKMFTKELFSDGKRYRILVRGKIDGISDDILIETKNRTKRLFYELRDYERVQLEAYFFLTGLRKALLTEHHNKEMNIIEYSHNEDFWDECVTKINEFINEKILIHVVP